MSSPGNESTPSAAILLGALPVGVGLGNVLGFLEVLYIRYRLRMLRAEDLPGFLEYLAGGAAVYGGIFGLTLAGALILLGGIVWVELRGDPGVRYPAMVLAVLAIGGGFPAWTQWAYYDVPGLFELDRYGSTLLAFLILGALLYGGLRRASSLHPWLRWAGRSMLRRTFLTVLLIANLIFLGASIHALHVPDPLAGTDGSGTGPPVILIGVDTLRADHLSPFGGDLGFRTPAARRLARDGVTYRNHIAQWPKTTPSFGSMFTSRYPAEIPIYSNAEPIPPDRVTLAERLSEHGYATAGIVSSYAVHGQFVGRGFDRYVNREDWGLKNLKLLRYLLHLTGGSMPTASAVRAIRSSRGNPFFLFLHYVFPHAPYHPPYPHSRRVDPAYRGRASGSQEALRAMRDGRAYGDSEDRAHVRALYDGEVAFTERRILRFLRVLERAGLYRRSLILYVSDHGENMDQHGRESWFKHRTLYESDLHVPLIVKYPHNRHAGTTVKAPTANLDLLPTVLAELGLPADEASRGRDLRPEDAQPRGRVLAQKKRAAALRTERWKYIHRFDTAPDELYDLRGDPRETRSRAEEHPELVRRWRSVLRDFRERHYRPPSPAEPTEKDRTRLEGLGYF